MSSLPQDLLLTQEQIVVRRRKIPMYPKNAIHDDVVEQSYEPEPKNGFIPFKVGHDEPVADCRPPHRESGNPSVPPILRSEVGDGCPKNSTYEEGNGGADHEVPVLYGDAVLGADECQSRPDAESGESGTTEPGILLHVGVEEPSDGVGGAVAVSSGECKPCVRGECGNSSDQSDGTEPLSRHCPMICFELTLYM